jgi:WD40 repeat protein
MKYFSSGRARLNQSIQQGITNISLLKLKTQYKNRVQASHRDYWEWKQENDKLYSKSVEAYSLTPGLHRRRYLFTADMAGNIKVWDLRSRRLVANLGKITDTAVSSIQITPLDGDIFLCTNNGLIYHCPKQHRFKFKCIQPQIQKGLTKMIATPDNRFFFITNEFSGIQMYKITDNTCSKIPYTPGSKFIRHDCSLITNDSKYLIMACESRMLNSKSSKTA